MFRAWVQALLLPFFLFFTFFSLFCHKLLAHGPPSSGPCLFASSNPCLYFCTWLIYFYHFIYVNRCIATPVVRQRAFHTQGVGSSPNAVTFHIFPNFFSFFVTNRYTGPLMSGLSFLLHFHPLPTSAYWPKPFCYFFTFLHFCWFLQRLAQHGHWA